MDPLITNGIDPTLRTMEKQGHDRELPSRRKRLVVREKTDEQTDEQAIEQADEQGDEQATQQAAEQAEDEGDMALDPDTPKHLLDDLV